jgi:CDP-6-deoxy-D-xylo-4-hexulose-3-dehydrase
MESLDGFVKSRKENFNTLKEGLVSCEDFIILPEATENSDPSWFGFPITLKENSGIQRVDLLKFLDEHNIGTRLLFAGNLTRQPYFKNVNYRIQGKLDRTDRIMNQTFWIGVYPGLTNEMLKEVINKIETFFGVKN